MKRQPFIIIKMYFAQTIFSLQFCYYWGSPKSSVWYDVSPSLVRLRKQRTIPREVLYESFRPRRRRRRPRPTENVDGTSGEGKAKRNSRQKRTRDLGWRERCNIVVQEFGHRSCTLGQHRRFSALPLHLNPRPGL